MFSGSDWLPLFVSDVSDRAITFYVSEHDVISSDNREFTASGGGKVAPSTVNTVTLDDVLDRLNIAHIDFLSMDIELHEPKALAGFSIDRFGPALVAIEAHRPVRQDILDYFARHHYVIVGDYWRADGHNLWFKPLPQAVGIPVGRQIQATPPTPSLRSIVGSPC